MEQPYRASPPYSADASPELLMADVAAGKRKKKDDIFSTVIAQPKTNSCPGDPNPPSCTNIVPTSEERNHTYDSWSLNHHWEQTGLVSIVLYS